MGRSRCGHLTGHRCRRRTGSWRDTGTGSRCASGREHGSYTDRERAEGRKQAAEVIKARCRYYAPVMGVSYGTVTIREQKTRWGSCSTKGNLNFNWKLVLMPPEILDYVVVHELAHRIQMNHSAAFWAEVGKILPDYKERRQWLKVNGQKY